VAGVPQCADPVQQCRRLPLRQRGGRLVEDHQFGPGAEDPGDLHELSGRGRQGPDRLVQVEVGQADPVQVADCRPALRGPVDDAEPAWEATHGEVVQHAEVR
jgi:hypothetical protein